ncbi:MAG: hypothetical protein MZV49_21770 [Rhodopseudomonas palustris]|nr:hypothetical protein [Rhodopseudomonas palustris]
MTSKRSCLSMSSISPDIRHEVISEVTNLGIPAADVARYRRHRRGALYCQSDPRRSSSTNCSVVRSCRLIPSCCARCWLTAW